ncbi:ribosomal RNA processing protein 1 homolog A-like [Paramacrobiotus metropolitanus]|uniref:ribosomal RNA processing protein 1 homolog A-like n=1 Tax=Paramacrobiotus metropolitanus TaxID=2943436 RepID=UPI002445E285|nr:ribosomal RNA processing protein 1 homolog A-like [Paramacrobiotus metropolitanus]
MKSSEMGKKRKQPEDVAGTPNPRHPKKSKNQIDELQLGSLAVELDFAKKLAANEKLQRDRAMRNLFRWLQSQCQQGKRFSKNELMVLWKGLYYCLWMADKPLVHEELADKMVSLLKCFAAHKLSAVKFLDAFFLTISREYSRIDRFRLDKFLMLTRRMFRGMVVWLRETGWSSRWTEHVWLVLRQNVLSGESGVCAEGLQNFLTEIFLTELEATLTEDGEEDATAGDARRECVDGLFRVFCDVLLDADTMFLRNAVQRNLLKSSAATFPRVHALLSREAVATYALQLGQNPHCPVKNRRALYTVHTHFRRPAAAVASDQDEVEDEDPVAP